MTAAERVLAHFDRISEAPDAILRLRRFVLALAVRGKLVEQDSLEAPANHLLQGRTRALTSTEEPWSLPTGWEWSSLRLLGDSRGGGTPSKGNPEFWSGTVPWVSPKDMKVDLISDSEDHISESAIRESAVQLVPSGSLLIVVRGMILAHSFPTAVTTVPVTMNQDMKAIVPFRADVAPILLLLTKGMRSHVLRLVRRSTHGTCRLLTEDLFDLPLPIPPLAEQQRIIAKVRELMPLCDRLEAAQKERESRRHRLVNASLAGLNQPNDDTALRRQARFHLQHLTRLTTSSTHIEQLRETIRNLAVLGHLAASDSDDRNLRDLLAALRVHVTNGHSSREDSEGQDRVPTNWTTVELGSICTLITSGSRGWAEFYADAGAMFIRAQNIRFGRLQLDHPAHVKPPRTTEGVRTRVSRGDLLIVITGAGVTNPAMIDQELDEAYVSQHVALIRPVTHALSRWLLLCLMAPAACRARLVERAYGAGKPGLNLEAIRSLEIPLPSLQVQRVVLQKVDELLAACDRLEAQLEASRAARMALLEATLRDALADAPHTAVASAAIP